MSDERAPRCRALVLRRVADGGDHRCGNHTAHPSARCWRHREESR